MSQFHVVIPAGGSGTRLWPLSRAGRPKFLLAMAGGQRSLLQATLDRLNPLAPAQRSWIVTGGAHAVAVARQLPALPPANVIVEPGPRDSGPAIGLAAALLHAQDPDSVMGSFASDHLVADEDAFREVVRTAITVADTGALVTIGITPTHPETGYGYIRTGNELGIGAARQVQAFTEKPPLAVAEQYVAEGHLWNAGMFVWRTASLLDELARQLPDLHAGLQEIARAWEGDRAEETLADVWPQLQKISIDHGVMEGAAATGRVATVPGDFGWNDVGDWHTLGAVLPPDADGNSTLGIGDNPGTTLPVDVTGSVLVPASGRLLAVLGMRDVVVVDTDDVVLVCPRERAQEVKALVDRLRLEGQGGLL